MLSGRHSLNALYSSHSKESCWRTGKETPPQSQLQYVPIIESSGLNQLKWPSECDTLQIFCKPLKMHRPPYRFYIGINLFLCTSITFLYRTCFNLALNDMVDPDSIRSTEGLSQVRPVNYSKHLFLFIQLFALSIYRKWRGTIGQTFNWCICKAHTTSDT